jgi:hypothetical protein
VGRVQTAEPRHHRYTDTVMQGGQLQDVRRNRHGDDSCSILYQSYGQAQLRQAGSNSTPRRHQTCVQLLLPRSTPMPAMSAAIPPPTSTPTPTPIYTSSTTPFTLCHPLHLHQSSPTATTPSVPTPTPPLASRSTSTLQAIVNQAPPDRLVCQAHQLFRGTCGSPPHHFLLREKPHINPPPVHQARRPCYSPVRQGRAFRLMATSPGQGTMRHATRLKPRAAPATTPLPQPRCMHLYATFKMNSRSPKGQPSKP